MTDLINFILGRLPCCPKCGSEIWYFEEGAICSNRECDWEDPEDD